MRRGPWRAETGSGEGERSGEPIWFRVGGGEIGRDGSGWLDMERSEGGCVVWRRGGRRRWFPIDYRSAAWETSWGARGGPVAVGGAVEEIVLRVQARTDALFCPIHTIIAMHRLIPRPVLSSSSHAFPILLPPPVLL